METDSFLLRGEARVARIPPDLMRYLRKRTKAVMNLSDVYAFKKVAATLSFTKAADLIGTSRSAISKQVQRLERNIGVTLVNRTTRSVNLTEAGRNLDRYTSGVDTRIELAIDKVQCADRAPRGTVSIAIPPRLATILAEAFASSFQKTFPDVQLKIQSSDFAIDVLDRGLDVAVEVTESLGDSNLISKRIDTAHQLILASPAYLSAVGAPQDISDLIRHRCLGLSSRPNVTPVWHLRRGLDRVDVPLAQAFVSDSYDVLIKLALAGHGILCVPDLYVRTELACQKLVELLADSMDPVELGVYALYPTRDLPTKTKLVIDFIESELSALREAGFLPSIATDVLAGNDEQKRPDIINIKSGLGR